MTLQQRDTLSYGSNPVVESYSAKLPGMQSTSLNNRKLSSGVIPIILGYLTLTSAHPHPGQTNEAVSHTSPTNWAGSYFSWMNRHTCRWVGHCGTMDPRRDSRSRQSLPAANQQIPLSNTHSLGPLDLSSYWTSGEENPEQWSKEERQSRQIPQYVYDFTPYVHLFSGEQFWPCDIAEHLVHTSPYQNYTLIRGMENDRTLDNLNDLNSYGRNTFLQSEDNVEERPDWLGGSRNIPSSPEDSSKEFAGEVLRMSPFKSGSKDGQKGLNGHGEVVGGSDRKQSGELQHRGGHSSAPAVLVVVPKDDGVVDAFWFYFYSYNLGNKVFNVRFGNHVGDWEHSMVRFRNGTPEAVYISEHGAGEAYAYHAVEKIGKRPVIYSATGTHAIYATPGLHPYILPWGLLHDETDRGPLWDPNLNHHAFVYNHTSRVLKSSAQTPHAPVNWFYYGGHWGDKIYPMSDPRQYRLLGQYHYVSGPIGPRYKNLGRKKVCQRNNIPCVIKHWLGDEDDRAKRLPGVETGDEVEDESEHNGVQEG